MADSDSMLSLGILISLRDQASQGIERIKSELAGLQGTAQETTQKIDVSFRQLQDSMMSVWLGWKSSLSGFRTMKGMFGPAIQTASSFESAMARVRAISGASGETFDRLQKQSRDLGRQTQFTAIQVAQAQELLARAGFNEEIKEITDAIPGLLDMANAEGMDLRNAADIAANTLRGFSLEASKMGMVSDVLAKTASITNTSISTLGESFAYVAPDAHSLGVTLQETAAMVGVLGDVGIKGSRAGTVLRMFFSRLKSPPKEGRKMLDALGINLSDANGNMLTMVEEIIPQLSQKLKGMGNIAKGDALKKIFGQQASTGVLGLLEAFENGKLQQKLFEIEEASKSSAKNMAETMNDTVTGAIGRMSSAFESLRITIGDSLKGPYRLFIDWITQIVAKIDAFLAEHPILTKMITRTAAVLMGLLAALVAIGGTALAIKGFIGIFALLKAKAALAMTGIAGKIGLVSLGFKGIMLMALKFAAIAAIIYYAWEHNILGIRDLFQVFSAALSMVFGANADGITEVDAAVAEKLKATGLWDYAVTLGRVFWRIRQFFEGFIEGIKIGFSKIGNLFSAIGSFFAPLVDGFLNLVGLIDFFKPVAESMSSAWRDWGRTLGELVPYVIAAIVAFKGFMLIKGIVGIVMGALQGLYAFVLANPITAALIVIGAVLVYCYTQFEGFRANVMAIWEAIVTYIGGVFKWLMGLFQFVIGIFTLDWDKMCEGMGNMFKGFGKAVQGVCDFISGLISGIWDGLVWIGEKLGIVEEKKNEVMASEAVEIGVNETRNKAQEFSDAFSGRTKPQSPPVATNFSQTVKVPEVQERIAPPAVKSTPSAPILAKQGETQTISQENAVSGAINENAFKIKNDTKVDVKVAPQNTIVNLDGDKLGETVTAWQVQQNIRMGASEIE